MPTYEYDCPACGRFEAFQSIKEEPLKECPTCHRPVKRAISKGGGIIFKGSGFYITDYRKPEYEKRRKEEQGESKSAPAAEGKEASSAKTAGKDAPAGDGGGAGNGGSPKPAAADTGGGEKT